MIKNQCLCVHEIKFRKESCKKQLCCFLCEEPCLHICSTVEHNDFNEALIRLNCKDICLNIDK